MSCFLNTQTNHKLNSTIPNATFQRKKNYDEERINNIISNLLLNDNILLPAEDLLYVCTETIKIIKQQPVFLELKSPINICGDIHGQYNDLLRIFKKIGLPGNKTPYLFLGDYVDRGNNSVDTILLLLAFKIKEPYNIFLLRGNHECFEVNEEYSFKDECIAKYGEAGESIWTMFNTVFQWLPLSAMVEDKILCLHGGLSKEMTSLDVLKNINRHELYNVPENGLVCDILWADPNEQHEERLWEDSYRGCSNLFGSEVVNNFCHRFNLDLIVRAHEVQDNGYSFFCNRKLVTVFSASNYCGDCGNNGAVLVIDRDLNCSFEIFEPNRAKQCIVVPSATSTTSAKKKKCEAPVISQTVPLHLSQSQPQLTKNDIKTITIPLFTNNTKGIRKRNGRPRSLSPRPNNRFALMSRESNF